MTSEDDSKTLKTQLTEMFSAERNGKRLGRGLVEVIVEFLVDVVLVKDISSEVNILKVKEYAADAWEDANDGAALPRIHATSINSWLAVQPAPPQGLPGYSPSFKGDDDEDDDDSRLFGAAGASQRGVESWLVARRQVCVARSLEPRLR